MTRLTGAQARRVAVTAQGFAVRRPAGPPNRAHLRRLIDRIQVLQLANLNRRIVHVGKAWPGNRNDIVIAKATITLPAGITTLTDGGYRSMPGATLPPTDDPALLAEHRRRRARIEHILARMKD